MKFGFFASFSYGSIYYIHTLGAINMSEDAPKRDDEACCGMIVCQIGMEWTHCPYCGSALPDDILQVVAEVWQ